MISRPLVSCIMPTCNRRRFVPMAIELFKRQDYEPRELVIVDDGSDSIADLVPDDNRIRYVRLDRKTGIGIKRNVAVEHARGEIIIHWDDDDWYASDRITYQVDQLLSSGADIIGMGESPVVMLQTGEVWQYLYPDQPDSPAGNPFIMGGTFCYWRTMWERLPFAPIDHGEDARMLMKVPAGRLNRIENLGRYVYMRHGRNSWIVTPSEEKRIWSRLPDVTLEKIVGNSDAQFYRNITTMPKVRLSHTWNIHKQGWDRCPQAGDIVEVTDEELTLLRSRKHRRDEIIEDAAEAFNDFNRPLNTATAQIEAFQKVIGKLNPSLLESTGEDDEQPHFDPIPETRAVTQRATKQPTAPSTE